MPLTMVVGLVIEVEGGFVAGLGEAELVGDEGAVAHLRHGGHEHPLLRVGRIMEIILGQGVGLGLDHGARVAEARHEACQHRDAETLGELEAVAGHIVCLLLCGGLEGRNHSEVGIEARVLLVLRRVHRGVVGGDHQQAAVGACHGRVDERVGRHVHADMLHRCHGPLAAERHAESLLHGRLLVRRPVRVNLALVSQRVLLHELENFG